MARTKAFDPDRALANALETFWQHGYEATSMQMLVGATGLSRSSLYDTFGDKRQLYCAALARYREWTEKQSALDSALPVRETLRLHFTKLIAENMAGETRRGCFVVNTAVELGPHDPEMAQTVRAALTASEQKFFDLLQRGIENGELSPDLDARATARFLLSSSSGLQVLAKAGQDRAMLQDIINTVLSVLK